MTVKFNLTVTELPDGSAVWQVTGEDRSFTILSGTAATREAGKDAGVAAIVALRGMPADTLIMDYSDVPGMAT